MKNIILPTGVILSARQDGIAGLGAPVWPPCLLQAGGQEGSIFPHQTKILLPASRDQNDNTLGTSLVDNFIHLSTTVKVLI